MRRLEGSDGLEGLLVVEECVNVVQTRSQESISEFILELIVCMKIMKEMGDVAVNF